LKFTLDTLEMKHWFMPITERIKKQIQWFLFFFNNPTISNSYTSYKKLNSNKLIKDGEIFKFFLKTLFLEIIALFIALC